MNERRTPENLTEADDQALGEALGSAIRGRVDAPAARPPVSSIAERAAARAKARNTRRAVVGIAASIALVAGGFAAWNALEDDQPTEVIVVDQPPITPEPAPTAAPIYELPDESPDVTPGVPADSTEQATPESLSTGPVLEWTEFDPASVFGTDVTYVGRVETVGDGRVLVEVASSEGNQVMVSENGADWTVIPMPPDFSVEHFDIAGSRWLVAGWPAIRMAESTGRAFFSDDQGTTWTDLDLPLDPAVGNETASLAAALVAGENMVVAVIGRTHPDVASIIVARGLVPDKESIRGWMSVEGDTVSFTRDESSAPESFELTSEEEDLLYGGIQRHVRLYFSDGGPAELVAEYPGWATKGYGADDGFHLTLIDDQGEWLLTSPNGHQWRQSPLVDGDGVPVGQVYAYSGSHQQTIWTADEMGSDYRAKRSEGVYAPPLVAKYPDGIRYVDRIAVGPAGTAVTAEAGQFPDFGNTPEFRLSKDDYELRYNEPVGGFTLWDLSEDAPVYEFDSETLHGDTPPQGLRPVEDDSGGNGYLVFEDPETGDDLVSFNLDDLQAALLDSMPDPEDESTSPPIQSQRPEQWVGWSIDGSAWGWQTISDAFNLADSDTEHANVELAVGADFVLARVETYDVETSDTTGGGDGVVSLISQSPRWFIAKAS